MEGAVGGPGSVLLLGLLLVLLLLLHAGFAGGGRGGVDLLLGEARVLLLETLLGLL